VGIGKTLTLTATDLYDKDCDGCGHAVQDTIDPQNHVKWSVGGNIGASGLQSGDKGTPKTWIATGTTHTSLAIRLYVDDDGLGGAAKTANDGGFLEVNSKNLDVVKPDSGSTAGSAETQCPSPAQAGAHGRWRSWTTTVARANCTVDFDGLVVNESGCDSDDFGCGSGTLAGSNNPAADATLVSNTSTVVADITGACDPANYTPAADCTQTRYCSWSIKASNGSYIDWGRFHYSFFWPHAGGIDQATSTRTWSNSL
jgi:hypothetical protein